MCVRFSAVISDTRRNPIEHRFRPPGIRSLVRVHGLPCVTAAAQEIDRQGRWGACVALASETSIRAAHLKRSFEMPLGLLLI
jgi:hypothetical protein